MKPQTQSVAIVTPAEAEVVAKTPLSLRDVFDRALSNGNPDIIGRMFDLYEKWEANQARKAFDAAVSAAKAELRGVAITKNRQVDYASTKGERGGRVQYKYEDLAAVLSVVEPILSNHGLSIGYGTEVEGSVVKVTCILKHRDGHRERNTLPGPFDTSGNKNTIQAMGSTVTYLQRYTLKAALGIAASEDDDGRGGPVIDPPASVDELQHLYDCINKTNTDLKKRGIDDGVPNELVLKKANVAKFGDIPAKLIPDLISWIRHKAATRYPEPPEPPEDMSDMPDIPAILDRRT